MLWVDKHRPKSLDKLILGKDVGKQLKGLAENGDCPHILFYGPSGAGKKTLALAFIREVFGPGVEKLKVENRIWQIELPSRKIEVELATISSLHHLEINPSEAGRRDVHVVQEIIKEMASSRKAALGKGSAAGKGSSTFKILLIDEIDRLTKQAQHALRRTMEKYSKACRLVVTCSNLSKVMDPVRSRCICVRVKAPRVEEVQTLLQHVAKREHLTLPDMLCERIAKHSQRNMRKALLTLETCRVSQYPFEDGQPLQEPEWQMFIRDIAADILREQTPKNLFLVRGKFYELLCNCIPPSIIFRELAMELISKMDDDLKFEVIKYASIFEHRLQLGSKPIFHLEAFVAKVMSIFKEWLLKLES